MLELLKVFLVGTALASPATAHTVKASYYGHGEKLNAHTSSGERFNPHAFTAAHRSLPLGTHLKVTYGSKTVVVRINDRGPAAWTGRSLDLSYGAASYLGMTKAGEANVKVVRID